MAKRKKYEGRAAAASGKKYVPVAVSDKNIGARKQAADSMKRAGVQSLSGLSGSQGQVARFKSEQDNLRREYNDKNTSDDRKEEIVKDLRGVSRDLNDQNRAAALNQVIREFGPGSVTNTGGIMGSDAGARFQQLRGNPNFYQDGRPGLETFVGNQGAFKTGDKNLFKQVHPNPLKILLGAATQIGNVSPMGLVRNIEKIRTGQPLIDMSFMDRNKSESPSRIKDFYSAYIEGMNKKIADAKSSKNKDQFDAVPLDPQFQNVEGKLLSSVDDAYGGEGPGYDEQLAKEILFGVADEEATGDPSNREDLQDEMDRTIFNQYSLLQDDSLADTLLDDTEETDLAEAINPKSDAVQNYEDEFMNTYGVDSDLFKTAEANELDYADRQRAEGDPDYLEGGAYDYNKNKPGVQTFFDIYSDEGVLAGEYPTRPSYLRDKLLRDMPISFRKNSNLPYEFIRDKGIAGGRETYDTAFQDVPFRTDNIPAEAFDSRSYLLPEAMSIVPKQFKDGGSVNTYDVLKLINDTMNDG